jgi:hypothetical protein
MFSLGAGVSRRRFLRVGGLGTLGLTLTGLEASRALGSSADRERSVILLMLVGGPSQLETFDPKPDAPAEVRGPFRSIATTVPGVRISEHLPRLSRSMDKLTLIRSLHHDAAPIHETGHQLLQTGRLFREGQEAPHFGSVAAKLLGTRGDLPPFVVLPRPLGNTGVCVPHGQAAGLLGPEFEPFHVAADPAAADYDAQGAFDLNSERGEVRDAYGRNTFGQSCLLARRLVEAGVRVVTVNMFDTVFNQVTWDCHGTRPFSTLDDYANVLLPTLDRALATLIDDLDRRGLLDSTLVVATGEFGRTPRINPNGGRDHWPGVWSALLAGGGVRGGQVIGSSDATASSPSDRPVRPEELVATIYGSLGIATDTAIALADGSVTTPVAGSVPIAEAFA